MSCGAEGTGASLLHFSCLYSPVTLLSPHVCLAGRERPKPELPKPWQQTLDAAAGRPFDFDAPSHTLQPPLEPWRPARHVAPCAGSAPAAASDRPPSAASTSPDAARPAEASAGPARHFSTLFDLQGSKARSRLLPLPLWHRWHMRRKKARSRALDARKALPPLKAIRAARPATAPASARSSTTHLRHVDAVVEAVSSFAGSSTSKVEQDHTFRLLAYAPFAQAVTHGRIQQAISAATASGSHPTADEHRSSIQHGQQARYSMEAETEPVPSRQQSPSSGPHRELPSTGKRLGFQWGSGFASGSSADPEQQGSVPDLISLMCSASSDSKLAEPSLQNETHAAGVSSCGTRLLAEEPVQVPAFIVLKNLFQL